jgi:thioredoxin 1
MMKKAYLKIGIAAFAVLGTYSLLACNGQKSANLPADEQPVDLTAKGPGKGEHGQPIAISEFDKMIAGDKLTMVDFYTTWCGPCKMMAPHVVKLKDNKSDLVNVLQIDAEAQMEISGRYNIEAYPTILFFKKGQVINKVVGARDYEQLLAEVEKYK